MSADWYVSPDQVPTWLYQAVHLTGPVRRLSDEELAVQIDTLSAKFENWLVPKKPWTSAKMTAGRFEAMKKAIVGLVMTVVDVEGSFKLNQHKSEADYAAVAGALAARPDTSSQQIAGLMRQARPDAFADADSRWKGARHEHLPKQTHPDYRQGRQARGVRRWRIGNDRAWHQRAAPAPERRRREEHRGRQTQGCVVPSAR